MKVETRPAEASKSATHPVAQPATVHPPPALTLANYDYDAMEALLAPCREESDAYEASGIFDLMSDDEIIEWKVERGRRQLAKGEYFHLDVVEKYLDDVLARVAKA